MPDLVDMFGAGGAQAIQFLIPLIFVLALIVVLAWALKLIRHPTHRAMAKGRHPRLSKMDSTPIDAKRSLILVRRDNVEHLILIGGSNDLVIESNINHASAPNQFQRPQRIEQAVKQQPVVQQATGHPASAVPNGGYPAPPPPLQDRSNNSAPVQRPVQPTHSMPLHEAARTENSSKQETDIQAPISVKTNAKVGQQPPVYPGTTQTTAAPSRLAATTPLAGKPISTIRPPVIPGSNTPKPRYPATAPQTPDGKQALTANPASLAPKIPVIPVTANPIEKDQSSPVNNDTAALANSAAPVIPTTIAPSPESEITVDAGVSDQSNTAPPRPIATSPLDMVTPPAAPVAPQISPVVQTANIPQSIQTTTVAQTMPSPAVSAPSNVSTGDAATDSIEEEMAKLLGELSAEPQKK